METLIRFASFHAAMLQSNSRNYKLMTLQQYSHDEQVMKVLKFVFDPYITTGISKKKLEKEVQPVQRFKTTLDLLEYIKEHNTGTDEVLSYVKGFMSGLGLSHQGLLQQIICKNMPIGISPMTINQVRPGFIPQFNVMLANKYFDDPEIVEGKNFTITTKIDGGRIIAMKDNGIVKFFTRAGQEYEGLVDLEEEMLKKMPDGIVLDGEITLLDPQGLDSKEQYRRTMMITRKLGVKHGVRMLVFDAMMAEDFKEQKVTPHYASRRLWLETLFASSKPTFFSLLPKLYTGSDTSVIAKLLNEQVAKGEEGIMININDEPYHFTRTNALLKVKKMQDVDLKVISLEEGNNQNKGKLGAFIVDYKGCNVRVGSGISKEIREQVWAHQEDYIGMTISVQYFEETQNQAGGLSLRFPVFLDFRFDK